MYKKIIALFIVSLFILSCNVTTGSDGGSRPSSGNADNGDTGNSLETVTVSGYVRSITDGSVVDGALVTLAAGSAVTDSGGFFTMTVGKPAGSSALVAVEKAGFTAYQNPLAQSEDGRVECDFFLKPVDNSVSIDPASVNTVTGGGGALVYLPAMTGIDEQLKVSITNYDVSTPDVQAISGDFSAIDAGGNEVYLLSLGMIDVDIRGELSGDYYSLEGKGPFTIRIPVTGDPSLAPAVIPLWYFDTKSNKWIEEGSARLIGSYYEGQVEHFSLWNADIVFGNDALNVTGSIVDAKYQSGDSYNVRLTGTSGSILFNQNIMDNYFTIRNLPINTAMTIRVTNNRNGYTFIRSITTPSTPAIYFNTGTYYLGNDCGDTIWISKRSPIPDNWVIIDQTATQYQIKYVAGTLNGTTIWVEKESPLYPDWFIIDETASQYQIKYVTNPAYGDTFWVQKASPIMEGWVIIGQTAAQYQLKYVAGAAGGTTVWVEKESPLYPGWFIIDETASQYQIKFLTNFTYGDTIWVQKSSPIMEGWVIIDQTASQYQLRYVTGAAGGTTVWVEKESPLYAGWFIIDETASQYQIKYLINPAYGDTVWVQKASPIMEGWVIIDQTASQYQLRYVTGAAEGTTVWVEKESPLYAGWFIIDKTASQYQIKYVRNFTSGDTIWVEKASPIMEGWVITGQTASLYQLKYIYGVAWGTTVWVEKESPIYPDWFIIDETAGQYQIKYITESARGDVLWVEKESPLYADWFIIDETATQYQIKYLPFFEYGDTFWVTKNSPVSNQCVIIDETAGQYQVKYVGGAVRGTTVWVVKNSPLYQNWFIIDETSAQYQIKYMPSFEYGDTFWITKDSPIPAGCVIIAESAAQYQVKYINGTPSYGEVFTALNNPQVPNGWYVTGYPAAGKTEFKYIDGAPVGTRETIVAVENLPVDWILVGTPAPDRITIEYVKNALLFQKYIGGNMNEKAASIQQTIDGGYILAGESDSTDIPGVIKDQYDNDFYLVKLDSSGNIQWQNMYGGSNNDISESVLQTSDGGYIMAGNSNSIDIPGTEPKGNNDGYVVKLDSSGNVEWQKLYGGSGNDYIKSIVQTADGGYIFAGSGYGSHLTASERKGGEDCYLVKLDSAGNVVWEKLYGGNKNEWGFSIQQTNDGGYVVAGTTWSTAIGGKEIKGQCDSYVFKINADGELQWENIFGGNGVDQSCSIYQTADGGYITAGKSNSTDITGIPGHTGIMRFNVYIVKLDQAGQQEWYKVHGTEGDEYVNSIVQNSDGTYITAGRQNQETYVMLLDENGLVKWDKRYGGLEGRSIINTGDTGFIVAGFGRHSNLPTSNGGVFDMYVFKLDLLGNFWRL